ncbi:hypothetical protein DEO72_LG10g1614 [Vigna unguiculata]|uniref:Uncharacterized protein n=1 Tax=Vigna unguiculata TaxID=3917 RepID=A0A4D6NC97_VIGUN|nr:hypothetical protein DEO72_LG10g1614 [Vigna unguiculata]
MSSLFSSCTFTFKVRTQPTTRCAFVIKMIDVPDIVKHIKSLIQPVQIGEFSDKSIIDIEGDNSIGIVSPYIQFILIY